MVTTLKREFGALCDGSQSLPGINKADLCRCQRTALVGMGMAQSLPNLGLLAPTPPTHVCHLPFHTHNNNLKMVKSPSLKFSTAWAAFLSC